MQREEVRQVAWFLAAAAPFGELAVLSLALSGRLEHTTAIVDLIVLVIVGVGSAAFALYVQRK